MDAIHVENLSKNFKDLKAVDDISFSVQEGEIFGFLGPNGAGKTTTINILTTLLKKTSGKAYINGYDIERERDQVRNSLGIVFQDTALDTKLTGKENLDFHAMMYDLGPAEREKKIREVLEIVELEDKADELVENYSGGMKRRLEIGRGLIHSPKVLFLDEPTIGLDAQTRRNIWEHIKKLNQEKNITISLTTHYMDEADFLCDRVAIIDHGRIVAIDTPENLKDMLGGDIITLKVEEGLSELIEHFGKTDWIKKRIHEEDTKTLHLTVERADEKILDIIKDSLRLGSKIKSIDIKKPSLEDVFLHFTGRRIRDENGKSDTRKERMRRRFH